MYTFQCAQPRVFRVICMQHHLQIFSQSLLCTRTSLTIMWANLSSSHFIGQINIEINGFCEMDTCMRGGLAEICASVLGSASAHRRIRGHGLNPCLFISSYFIVLKLCPLVIWRCFSLWAIPCLLHISENTWSTHSSISSKGNSILGVDLQDEKKITCWNN